MTHLVLPEGLITPQLETVIEALAPATTRLVGGAVREALLGQVAADLDLATTATPDVVIERLEKASIRVEPTGMAHGTVTAICGGQTFEITTLRRDMATDGRHAQVAFTESFEEDAARRDFTFNAMMLDLDGTLYDFHNGQADLEAGIVRFIGEPETRMREDYLRILRYYRFYAWYGREEPEAGLKDALDRLSLEEGFAELSAERVTQEMLKMLSAPDPVPALTLFQPSMAALTLGFESNDADMNVEALAAFIQLFEGMEAPLTRLICLYADVPGESPALLNLPKLRFSRAQQDFIRQVYTATHDMPELPQPVQLCYKLGKDVYLTVLRLAAVFAHDEDTTNKIIAVIAEMEKTDLPTFPVRGDDLLARNMKEGAEMGKVLQQLEDWWVLNGFPERAAVLMKLDDMIGAPESTAAIH